MEKNHVCVIAAPFKDGKQIKFKVIFEDNDHNHCMICRRIPVPVITAVERVIELDKSLPPPVYIVGFKQQVESFLSDLNSPDVKVPRFQMATEVCQCGSGFVVPRNSFIISGDEHAGFEKLWLCHICAFLSVGYSIDAGVQLLTDVLTSTACLQERGVIPNAESDGEFCKSLSWFDPKRRKIGGKICYLAEKHDVAVNAYTLSAAENSAAMTVCRRLSSYIQPCQTCNTLNLGVVFVSVAGSGDIMVSHIPREQCARCGQIDVAHMVEKNAEEEKRQLIPLMAVDFFGKNKASIFASLYRSIMLTNNVGDDVLSYVYNSPEPVVDKRECPRCHRHFYTIANASAGLKIDGRIVCPDCLTVADKVAPGNVIVGDFAEAHEHAIQIASRVAIALSGSSDDPMGLDVSDVYAVISNPYASASAMRSIVSHGLRGS